MKYPLEPTPPPAPMPDLRLVDVPRRHTNEDPLWLGPCGEGPLGGVTQSMLVRFFSCRERFRLKYLLGLEPPDRWHHTFGYGNMWHACEEALAREEDWTGALDQHVAEMERQYPLQGDDLAKWHNVCHVQFPEYVEYWQHHPDVLSRTPLLQEQVFDVPYQLPSGRVVRLRGKWDSVDLIEEETEGLLGRHRKTYRGIYLQENKTKGDIDQVQVERQLKFDLQTMMYTVAIREAKRQGGDGSGTMVGAKINAQLLDNPVLGVRYNVVRRPLSGGKGNISPHKAKATKTKFTPAESAEQFYERLRRDYIAKDPAYWFFRVKVGISPQDVQVFQDTCLDPLLEHLCWWYDCMIGVKNRILPTSAANYRTPFGVYSALEEGGATEYDHYMATGSESTLRRVHTLFPELQ